MDADKDYFTLKISGFDKTFGETLSLVATFLDEVKADDRKLKTLVDDARVTERTFFKSNNEVAEALFEYVQYGSLSQYMTKLSLGEVKKIKGEELTDIFRQVQQVECNLHYCGTLEAEDVARQLKSLFDMERITEASTAPAYREFVSYDRPLVFFYDMPHVFQNIIYAYMACDPLETLEKRHEANLFSCYFGEGMSSLMFQEICEFRSLAYYASGAYRLPPLCYSDKPARFVTYLSTQSDKTMDALKTLCRLIRDMPERPEKIAAVIRAIVNLTHNSYPSFREISTLIAACRRDGYAIDPNRALLDDIVRMDMSDVSRFYRSHVKDRTLAYIVVGNSRKMDMRQLSRFGDVVKMRKQDFVRR